MQNPKTASAKRRATKTFPLTKTTGWTLLGVGAIALIISVIFSSQIPAFIGLALIFWGAILTYIRNEEYVKTPLLEATALSSLATLDQLLQQNDYNNKAIYLPPRYFKNPETTKAYIPKQKDQKPPTPEQIQNQETQLFTQNPQGMLTTPPGAELTKFLEKTLGTTFTKEDMQHVQQNIPKLLIEDLEIAQNLEIKTENNKITVTIENTVFHELCKETQKLTNVYNTLGTPLSSAIACILAKATGKPTIIEKETINEHNKNIEIEYRLIQEEPPTA